MELIVANTCFKRPKNKLASNVSGSTVSTINYLLQGKVTAGEECESQHRLLVTFCYTYLTV